jgi:hypothetical protein
LRKDRPAPAAALLKLARTNLRQYPPQHEHLDLSQVRALIDRWLAGLEAGGVHPLTPETRPTLVPPTARTQR